MSLDQAVTTTFKSKDKTSAAFNKMSKNAKKFGESSSRAFKKASKGAVDFQTITKGILSAGIITQAISGLTQGLGAVTTQFVQFDDAITAASAKFKGLNLTTKQGQQTLEALKLTAREVGATTKFSGVEASQGLDFYATAGFNAAQAMAVLAPTAKLATIANLDLARTSDIASDSLGIFGLATKDPIKLQQNFTKMSDQMARTMTTSNTTMEQMFETIKGGGSIFMNSGQSMATFNTLVGTLANESIKGEKAGTGLRALMAKLAKPSGEAAKAMQKLGVQTADQGGNFRDLFDILGDFEKGMKNMGTQQKLATIKTIFGLETMNTFSTVMKAGTKNLKKYREEIIDSGKATDQMATIMEQSLGNQLKSLASAATETGFRFFEAFEQRGAGAIQTLIKEVRTFNLNPIIEAVETGIKVFSTIFDLISRFSDPLKIVIGAWAAYAAIMKTVAVVQGIVNAVMLANPISLIIVGIVALVAGAVALVQNWDAVVATFRNVNAWFDKIMENPFIRGFAAIFAPFIKIPLLIIDNWKPVADFFGGLFDKIASVVGIAGRFLGFDIGESDQAAGQRRSGELSRAARVPPNKVQVDARQNVNFKGRIDVAGAPEGSTAQTTAGPPGIDFRLMGM